MISPRPIPELLHVDPAGFRETVVAAYQPVVLRGLVRDWPAVRAGATSAAALADYVKGFDRGAPVETFMGPAAINGRFFYRDDMAGFNFERRPQRIGELFDRLLAPPEDAAPLSLYAGAVPTPEHLPGFQQANPLALLDPRIAPRMWIGNASIVAAHYDLSDNLACVVAGRRRFTLFPPEQVANLYVGPLDHTIAGQSASMAFVQDPDLQRHPRMAEAMQAAQTAELEPGDAIYIPTLWWHSVQSLDRLNVLVNYWWDEQPPDSGSPLEALIHGVLAIGHMPQPRRAAWRAMFDHYVFKTGGEPAEHLAPEHRGVLGTSTPDLRRRIRAFLLRGMSRP
ncbi:MAG: cupin-like domain-containing protein [Phenylobacterium sp.]